MAAGLVPLQGTPAGASKAGTWVLAMVDGSRMGGSKGPSAGTSFAGKRRCEQNRPRQKHLFPGRESGQTQKKGDVAACATADEELEQRERGLEAGAVTRYSLRWLRPLADPGVNVNQPQARADTLAGKQVCPQSATQTASRPMPALC